MKSLSYYAQVVIDDEVWISHNRFSGLFRINLMSDTAAFVGKFPEYKWEEEELHLFAKKYENKIFFFPKRSGNIDIYDLKTGEFTYIKCKTNNRGGYATVIGAFRLDENRVLTVPCYSDMALQELSIPKETIIQHINLIKSGQYVENETNTIALYSCRMLDEIFYPIHGTNKVGSYHLKEKKEKVYRIDGLKNILGDIIFDGVALWINADQGIYQWNPYKNNLTLVCDCSSEKEGWIEQFVLYKQDIICIPRWLNNIKIINRQNFQKQEVHIDRQVLSKNIDMAWRDVRESFVWRDNLIISPIKYKEAICINLNNYKISYKKWESLEVISIEERFFVREKSKEDLQDYIIIVEKNKEPIDEIVDSCVGNSILQKIEMIID